MNVVFWFLVIVVLALVWFCLAFAFGKVGSFAYKIFKDAKDEIDKEYEDESASAEHQKTESEVSLNEER